MTEKTNIDINKLRTQFEQENELRKELVNLQKKIDKLTQKKEDLHNQLINDYGNSNFFNQIQNIDFYKDEVEFLKNKLEEYFKTKFELVSVVTKTKENHGWHEDLGELDGYLWHDNFVVYCAKFFAPKPVATFIYKNQKNLTYEKCNNLFNRHNIFLIEEDWLGEKSMMQTKYYEKYSPRLSLKNVFRNFIRHTSNNNLYYKDDEKFLNAIFETLNYYFIKKEEENKEKKVRKLQECKKEYELAKKKYMELKKEM